MWTNFKKMATEKCNKFPAGTPGHSSCVANALGYVSIELFKAIYLIHLHKIKTLVIKEMKHPMVIFR